MGPAARMCLFRYQLFRLVIETAACVTSPLLLRKPLDTIRRPIPATLGGPVRSGKVLSTKLMLELHTASCGKSTKQHNCKECGRGYTTKQALVAHLKAKHGPPPMPEELTCPTCGKLFKVHKTMKEHLAVHKGPYPCPVEGCGEGPYSERSRNLDRSFCALK